MRLLCGDCQGGGNAEQPNNTEQRPVQGHYPDGRQQGQEAGHWRGYLQYIPNSAISIMLDVLFWHITAQVFMHVPYLPWHYFFNLTIANQTNIHQANFLGFIENFAILGPATRRVPYSNHFVCLSVHQKNFNIGHNFFFTFRDRSFIFGMCVPYYTRPFWR